MTTYTRHVDWKGDPYWVSETGDRITEGEDYLGKYEETSDGKRTHFKKDVIGEYKEDGDGNKQRKRVNASGVTYWEHEDGTRTIEGRDWLNRPTRVVHPKRSPSGSDYETPSRSPASHSSTESKQFGWGSVLMLLSFLVVGTIVYKWLSRDTADPDWVDMPPIPAITQVWPPSSFSGMQGWLVRDGIMPPDHSGLHANDPNAGNTTLYLFQDGNWSESFKGARLSILSSSGVFEFAFLSAQRRPYDTELSLRGATIAPSFPSPAWLLPAPVPPGASAVKAAEESTGKRNLRRWTLEKLGFELQQTGSRTARLVVTLPQRKSFVVGSLSVKAEEDSAMGFPDTGPLDIYTDWRVPIPSTGFRLSNTDPFIFVVLQSGYECMNYRSWIVTGNAVRQLKPDYYSCMY